MRSADALEAAVGRERLVAEIARKVRAELDLESVVGVATRELESTLSLDEVSIVLGPGVRPGVPILVGSERVGTLELRRSEPLADGERFLVETVAREIGMALETARLLSENRRRLEQQAALLQAAQAVTSELELELVLERLVEEVTKLLGADARRLLPARRRARRAALRRRLRASDPALVGFEFPSDARARRPGARRRAAGDDGRRTTSSTSRRSIAAYGGFAHALVAPMVWAGEARGVLGVGMRDPERRFAQADARAARGVRRAWPRSRSATPRASPSGARARRGSQRGFYRIAACSAEPLSLAETFDAAAQAATEALGGAVRPSS